MGRFLNHALAHIEVKKIVKLLKNYKLKFLLHIISTMYSISKVKFLKLVKNKKLGKIRPLEFCLRQNQNFLEKNLFGLTSKRVSTTC